MADAHNRLGRSIRHPRPRVRLERRAEASARRSGHRVRTAVAVGQDPAKAVHTSGLSWLSLVRTLGEGVEDRLGLGRDAWLGCEALVADHDGRGA